MSRKRKHIPDPFTHEKRAKTSAERNKKLQENEDRMAGINPAIQKSIPIELKAVRTEGVRQQLPAQLVLHHEAEKLDELAARWTDHYMSAMKKAGFEFSERKGHELWENAFDTFIEKFVKKMNIKNIDKVINEVDAIQEYTRLPEVVRKQRERRYRTFQKIVNNLLAQKASPELNLLRSVERTVNRRGIAKGETLAVRNRTRAIDICVAASIYADLKVAYSKTEEKTSWMRYYQNGIHLIWESSKLPDSIAKSIKNLKR